MGRFWRNSDERGRFPAVHTAGVDPGLVGPGAIDHPAVREWHRWLREGYQPRHPVALVAPCSNVKPYTRSPTSRKIRGLLRRLGLWDEARGEPSGIEWLYLSDLLALVPYQRAEEYPACCYELSPDEALGNPRVYREVVATIRDTVSRLAAEGKLDTVILFLPRKHLEIWGSARSLALARGWRWPREKRVTYTIFSTRQLEEAIRNTIRS